MRSSKTIHVVSCHAEGEVGDVIVGGVQAPPGATLWEQRDFIAADQTLRKFMLNEPRGGVFRHVNLLVPAKNPNAAMGFIVMEPEDTPPMSGSNSICVATVMLDTGIVPMIEPQTRLVLEAPGGLIEVVADCRDGKAERITVRNVASFADKLDALLEVPGVGTLTVDTAYGGDSFVIVNAHDLGFGINPDEARQMSEIGVRITAAANDQIGFRHPENPAWDHFSFCLFAGPLAKTQNGFSARSAVSIRPGKIDRSPTGTAVSARMAVLHARGEMQVGKTFLARSILNSIFLGRIEQETSIGGRMAIIPSISGRAWITGLHQYLLDPADPWPSGYRVNDSWPNSK